MGAIISIVTLYIIYIILVVGLFIALAKSSRVEIIVSKITPVFLSTGNYFQFEFSLKAMQKKISSELYDTPYAFSLNESIKVLLIQNKYPIALQFNKLKYEMLVIIVFVALFSIYNIIFILSPSFFDAVVINCERASNHKSTLYTRFF